jgi:hypothetical protein
LQASVHCYHITPLRGVEIGEQGRFLTEVSSEGKVMNPRILFGKGVERRKRRNPYRQLRFENQ